MDKVSIEERLNIGALTSVVESLRQEGILNNEQAALIESIPNLAGDEAILANRILNRGLDPFAIQLQALGAVQPHIRLAHFQGPGSLEGEEQEDWLLLASLSHDEHGDPIPLSEKLSGLEHSVKLYLELSQDTDSAKLQRARRIEQVREKIVSLPFTVEVVGGREMRVYEADLGFAAAYWSGEDFAAVRQPDGLTFVGSKHHSLADLAIEVNKQLSPTFGIIFP